MPFGNEQLISTLQKRDVFASSTICFSGSIGSMSQTKAVPTVSEGEGTFSTLSLLCSDTTGTSVEGCEDTDTAKSKILPER